MGNNRSSYTVLGVFHPWPRGCRPFGVQHMGHCAGPTYAVAFVTLCAAPPTWMETFSGKTVAHRTTAGGLPELCRQSRRLQLRQPVVLLHVVKCGTTACPRIARRPAHVRTDGWKRSFTAADGESEAPRESGGASQLLSHPSHADNHKPSSPWQGGGRPSGRATPLPCSRPTAPMRESMTSYGRRPRLI